MAQFTRREFIATTALGTAAAMFPFSSYLFAEENACPSERLFAARADDALALYERPWAVMKSRGRGRSHQLGVPVVTHWVPGVTSDDKTKNEKIARPACGAARRGADDVEHLPGPRAQPRGDHPVLPALASHGGLLLRADRAARQAASLPSCCRTGTIWRRASFPTSSAIRHSPLYNPTAVRPAIPAPGSMKARWSRTRTSPTTA